MYLLVDGHNLLFRSFHGVPDRIRGVDGTPINAVVGFIGSLLNRVRELEADHVLVVFDAETGSFRDSTEGYKSGRVRDYGHLDEGANPFKQLDAIKRALDNLRIRWIEVAGVEADDVIATCARRFSSEIQKCVILSTDVDLYQLIGDNVVVAPNSSKLVGRDDVVRRFGVDPADLPFLRSLLGDRSDSVKGVRGIGPRSGRSIVQSFRSPDALFANLSSLPNRVRRALDGRQAQVAETCRLLTLNHDVHVDLTPEDVSITVGTSERTMSVLRRIGLV